MAIQLEGGKALINQWRNFFCGFPYIHLKRKLWNVPHDVSEIICCLSKICGYFGQSLLGKKKCGHLVPLHIFFILLYLCIREIREKKQLCEILEELPQIIGRKIYFLKNRVVPDIKLSGYPAIGYQALLICWVQDI